MTDQPTVPGAAETQPQDPRTVATPSIADLKQFIADVKSGATTVSAEELVALADKLVAQLSKPRITRSAMSPEEKRAHRKERRDARKRGEYIRQGKPWSEEQRAKQQAAWTPERRAQAAEKAKGRVMSPEAKANVQKAAAMRKERQQQMEARLKELEALLAEKQAGSPDAAVAAVEAQATEEHRGRGRGGRR